MSATRKAEPNEMGVTWAPSRSGRVRIAMRHQPGHPKPWHVWGIYTGTHDLAPITREFRTEAEARAHANRCWRAY